MDTATGIIDCACVIYGNAYSWKYVDCLYGMIKRNLNSEFNLHVYTEADRPVPDHMIKHALTEWPEVKLGRAWWYKMQLFNPMHHAGPLLYFDLDTVIIGNIDWIAKTPTNYFNTVRDFKYLWSPNFVGVNSSVMWWDTVRFSYLWDSFCAESLKDTQLKYRGDQDFISAKISANQVRYFDKERVKSWRWQCLDGGYNFKKRCHKNPGTGTQVSPDTSVMIFHGAPKPDQIQDPFVLHHWTV